MHLARGRVARRVLIPAATVVFSAGILLSAVLYYSDKPAVDLKRAVISNLARPTDNPRGYLAAGFGMAFCGLLLIPAALWFYRVLGGLRAGAAALGLWLFGAGLSGAVFIGFMAPFQDAYSGVHIYVAYATFLFMALGTLVWMAMATRASLRAGGGRGLLAALIAEAMGAAFLLYMTAGMVVPFGPDFFDDSSLPRSAAVCEWVLCAGNVIYLFILGAAVERVEALTTGAEAASAQSR
ncbi:MAG TPA: hypothetical protein VKB88_32755 [Bryobacteraceae bacterium]|nr:hypothetical protein [Bryobacteraceae bacterium]